MDSRLSLQQVFLIVFICIRHGTALKCKQGEPKNEEKDAGQPDLNITLSSGLVAHVGDKLIITCIADKPRYQFRNTRPMPPVEVKPFFKRNQLKICPGTEGRRVVCVDTVTLSKAENMVSVSCFARNSDGRCRIKTLTLTILERTIQKSNSTNSSKMLTPADQFMPTVSLTMDSNRSLVTTGKSANSSKMSTPADYFMPTVSLTMDSNRSLMTTEKSTNSSKMSTQADQFMPTVSLTMDSNRSLVTTTLTTVEMISSSSMMETNFTLRVTSVASSLTTTVNSESASAPRNPGGKGGKQGEEKLEDDDEVDDVKKLITATLILVIITLVLMAVAIVYVVRSLAIS